MLRIDRIELPAEIHLSDSNHLDSTACVPINLPKSSVSQSKNLFYSEQACRSVYQVLSQCDSKVAANLLA